MTKGGAEQTLVHHDQGPKPVAKSMPWGKKHIGVCQVEHAICGSALGRARSFTVAVPESLTVVFAPLTLLVARLFYTQMPLSARSLKAARRCACGLR